MYAQYQPTALEPIAAQVIRTLGARSRGGMAHCPAHRDRTPSLSVTERNGRLLFYCHAGCSQDAVMVALRDLGGMGSNKLQGQTSAPADLTTASKPSEKALNIWRETTPLPDTFAEIYLRSRGLLPPYPISLRYHSALPHTPTGQHFPALVAGVVDRDGQFCAVHRTYLKLDGTGKAAVSAPKMALGAFHDGAVRLALSEPAIGLAEGIETALTVQKLFQIPMWAVLGTRYASVTLPQTVREIQIFADNGEPGIEAARKGAERFTGEGIRVFVRRPLAKYGDWNDVFQDPDWHRHGPVPWEF